MKPRFRIWLPMLQTGVAVSFGGVGLSQRYAILNQPFLGGTGWESTARFHVWPWPLKFAAILNIPALLAGSLASLPLQLAWSRFPDYLGWLFSLFFVPLIWHWMGSRLDRRWQVRDKVP